MTSQQFALAPISAPLFYTFGIALMVFFLAFASLTGYLLIAMKRISLSVTSDRLEIAGLYGRSIDRSALKMSDARIINIDENADYQPVWRTNGIGLPNYKGGWFRLKNGQKALLFVSDSAHVVTIPTTGDYILMLSPVQPEAFIESLSAR